MAAIAPRDQVLVQRFQQGDNTAFDALVRKYQGKICHLIRRYVKNADDALDVSQEAFIKAYRALPQFRGDSAFYTWMYRIAINTAKNYLASRSRHVVEEEIEPDEAEHFESGDLLRDYETPEDLLMTDELTEVIQGTLNRLPEELRTALVLREFHDHSYEEIAEIMGCPVGTIRSRIFRARAALDKELAYLHH